MNLVTIQNRPSTLRVLVYWIVKGNRDSQLCHCRRAVQPRASLASFSSPHPCGGKNDTQLRSKSRRAVGWPSPGAAVLTLPPALPAGALEDLERAVTLSGGRGRAARQGFVQRGLLARLQGRDDDARRDFERAARLGSSLVCTLGPSCSFSGLCLSSLML